MDEILERQLITQGRVFATFSTIEKALAGRKKRFQGPYVGQAAMFHHDVSLFALCMQNNK